MNHEPRNQRHEDSVDAGQAAAIAVTTAMIDPTAPGLAYDLVRHLPRQQLLCTIATLAAMFSRTLVNIHAGDHQAALENLQQIALAYHERTEQP